jgi:hypothetical protein
MFASLSSGGIGIDLAERTRVNTGSLDNLVPENEAVLSLATGSGELT